MSLHAPAISLFSILDLVTWMFIHLAGHIEAELKQKTTRTQRSTLACHRALVFAFVFGHISTAVAPSGEYIALCAYKRSRKGVEGHETGQDADNVTILSGSGQKQGL